MAVATLAGLTHSSELPLYMWLCQVLPALSQEKSQG